MIHDPTVTTAELAEQLANAVDPQEVSYLKRVLSQRQVVERKTPFTDREVPGVSRPSLESFGIKPEPTAAEQFKAIGEVTSPHAQRFINKGFKENNPIARRVLGDQVGGGPLSPQEQADAILSRFPKTPPKRLPPSSTSAAERAGYPQVEADEILGSPWGDDLNNLFTGRERQLKANQHARDFRKKPGQD
jgi:hypothetical protein